MKTLLQDSVWHSYIWRWNSVSCTRPSQCFIITLLHLGHVISASTWGRICDTCRVVPGLFSSSSSFDFTVKGRISVSSLAPLCLYISFSWASQCTQVYPVSVTWTCRCLLVQWFHFLRTCSQAWDSWVVLQLWGMHAFYSSYALHFQPTAWQNSSFEKKNKPF